MIQNHTQQRVQPTISAQLKRPQWQVPQMIWQLVLIICDVSPSMAGEKARQAIAAIKALLQELALPINRGAFHVGLIDFAEDARWIHRVSPAVELAKLTFHLSIRECTNITAGLRLALDALNEPMATDAGITWKRPVVMTLSDGEHNTGPSPESAADQIKAIADHITVGFGPDHDSAMLTALASSPQHYYCIRDDGKELRQFLMTAGKTLTQTMIQRTSATQALTKLQ